MNQSEMERFEHEAEKAFSAIYEKRGTKESFDAAIEAFRKAIDIAEKSGLKEQAVRLAERRNQLRATFEREFRGA